MNEPIKIQGTLVWADEYFQRGPRYQQHDIDPDAAFDGLVGACIAYPERAAGLSQALADASERQRLDPKPYVPPSYADDDECERCMAALRAWHKRQRESRHV